MAEMSSSNFFKKRDMTLGACISMSTLYFSAAWLDAWRACPLIIFMVLFKKKILIHMDMGIFKRYLGIRAYTQPPGQSYLIVPILAWLIEP